MNRPVLRFLAVFAAGVGLVWVLAIGPGGSFFRDERPWAAADAERGKPAPFAPSVRGSDPSGGSGLVMRGARIPMTEELKDRPGVSVTKYVLHIGEITGQLAKRMPARDVRIDIHNKEPAPNERVQAVIHGSQALITFDTVPDPRARFGDSKPVAMTLTERVRVEYLDEQGQVLTTLQCAQLDMSEQRFSVPGRAVIDQEGLHLEGDGLVYDTGTGCFSFERDVLVRGTRFSLPKAGAHAAEEDPSAPPVEKVITCDGAFSFTPDEPVEGGAAPERPAGDLAEAIGGGRLLFEDNVTFRQGPTELRQCDRLSIQLARVETAAGPDGAETVTGTGEEDAGADSGVDSGKTAAAELQVTRVEAYGKAGGVARMIDPQATLLAETLLLERTAGGQLVTLRGQPQVQDVRRGEGERQTTMSFGAGQEIRLRPQGAPQDAVAEAPQRMVLELLGTAWMQSESADPNQSMRLDAERLDLFLVETNPDTEAGDGDAASGDAAEAAPRMDLERLLAQGNAQGVFALGSFFGDRIELLPVDGAEGEADFRLEVSPNPRVSITQTEPEPDGGGAPLTRQIDLLCADGLLTYNPSGTAAGEGVEAVPPGALIEGPTRVTVTENGAIAMVLDADRSVRIDLEEDAGTTEAGGLSGLVAEGNVRFDSPTEGVSGTADRLTLEPRADQSHAVLLQGRPAHATQLVEGEEPRVITARFIQFDPETGELHAWEAVETRIAVAAEGEAPGEPGTLTCDDLRVQQGKDAAGKDQVEVHATGQVRFDDPALGIVAQGDRLKYVEATGVAELYGSEGRPARVNQAGAADGAVEGAEGTDDPIDDVSIRGPLILIEQETRELTCPRQGRVVLVRRDAAGIVNRVTAESEGPIEYAAELLTLRDNVLVRFEEDGVETRALWCDTATVTFRKKDKDAEAAQARPAATDGFDRLFAQGGVHLEQSRPRALVGEGESLEWRQEDGQPVMILRGVHPQAWVIGLMDNRHLRYEADSFRLFQHSQEFEVKNGRFSFIEDER